MGCGWEGNLSDRFSRRGATRGDNFVDRIRRNARPRDTPTLARNHRIAASVLWRAPRSWVLYLVMGLTLALLALGSLTAVAHETDQYTLPVGREFAELGPHFSRVFYNAVVEAVNSTNASINRSLRNGGTTGETLQLQSAEAIAGEVWLRLFSAFPFNESLDGGLASTRVHSRYPGLITVYRPEQSIYEDPVLMLDVTKLVRTFARACTVNVDGTLFGTDKIIHFINLGRIYHSAYLSAKQHGLAESEAVYQAVQLSAGNNLLLSENALLGMLTTGIYSNADLAANYAGFKFYRNLTEETRIGNRVMPPMLIRDGPYWRLNEQVQPDSDFFTAFVTPHWNEALNPNVYAVVTDTRVRAMLHDRCPDLLDWYRDERGQRLSRDQFVAIERELSTWYGEPYGYKDDGENRVSIATTCFSPDHLDLGNHPSQTLPDPARKSVVDELGRTRLWWAARHGQLEEVERLLEEGENPNQTDIDGEGPLHAAARWGQVDVLELLLSHGANIGARAAYGRTPLHVSVERAQLGTARALLNHSADANARDLFGRSPLHDAVGGGNDDLAVLLLRHGANPGAPDDNGTTPLHLAARGGSAVLVTALLSYGANPSAKNSAGATAYDVAKQQDRKEVLKQLSNINTPRPGRAIAEAH